MAKSITRVINFIRGDTIEMPPRKPEEQPSWVSVVPEPVQCAGETRGTWPSPPMDIAYTMAPFLLGPDDALVMTGRGSRIVGSPMSVCGIDTSRVSIQQPQACP